MKRPIHVSHHMMGKFYTDVRAPAGTPRFYGVRECKGCGAEEIEHAAGQFTDDDLGKPCRVSKTTKPTATKPTATKPSAPPTKPTKPAKRTRS